MVYYYQYVSFGGKDTKKCSKNQILSEFFIIDHQVERNIPQYHPRF